MAKLTIKDHAGAETVLDVAAGTSVMEAAREAGLEGIVAECGGAMACATCHVYVDAAWQGKVGGAGEMEADLLEFAASEANAGSRLSCQIEMSEALDGLVVTLPEHQV